MAENTSQSWYKRWPHNEFAETIVLNCEEYGLLQRFRDYSIVNNGIENDLELIQRLGARFGLSRYKLKKLWPRIENFFTLREQRFLYEQDEQERHQLFIIRGKRQLAGRLGAQARWTDRDKVASGGENLPMASAMANAIGLPPGLPSEVEVEVDVEVEGEPPPPTPASESPGGGGGAPLSAQVVTDEDFRQIAQRALDLGMAAPARSLAAKIRKKFGDRPIESVIRALVRWEGQEHVGLWGAKSADDFDLEAARQGSDLSRKQSQRELDNAQLLDRARERDRKKAGA